MEVQRHWLLTLRACDVGFDLARSEKDRVVLELGSAAACLLLLAEQCNVDLGLSVHLKIKLNAKKYPAVLVRYGRTIDLGCAFSTKVDDQMLLHAYTLVHLASAVRSVPCGYVRYTRNMQRSY